MPFPPTLTAYVLLTCAALAWSANVVVSRAAVGEVSPMLLTALRWVVVIGALAPLRIRTLRHDAVLLRQHWSIALFMGAAGFTVFSACLYVAAYHTSAVNLAILQGTMPVLVLLGGVLLQATIPGALQSVGVIFTIIGVGVVACKGDLHVLTTLSFSLGDLIMLVGCASYAGYTLMLRRRPDMPGATFFFLMVIGGFVSSVPLVGFEVLNGSAVWPTLKGWMLIVFVGLAPSLFAQRAFMRAVELIGPGRAGIFVNLVPIFGALMSVWILGEAFGSYHAVALALVLAGILLAEHRAFSRRSDGT